MALLAQLSGAAKRRPLTTKLGYVCHRKYTYVRRRVIYRAQEALGPNTVRW